MTLTGTWIKTPAGTLALKWTPAQAPVRHLHKLHTRHQRNKGGMTRHPRGAPGATLAARLANLLPGRPPPFVTQSQLMDLVKTDRCDIERQVQELEGSEEQRISLLAAESDLYPRLIRIALDYAAEHPDEVRERIDRNRAVAERSRRIVRQREALLA